MIKKILAIIFGTFAVAASIISVVVYAETLNPAFLRLITEESQDLLELKRWVVPAIACFLVINGSLVYVGFFQRPKRGVQVELIRDVGSGYVETLERLLPKASEVCVCGWTLEETFIKLTEQLLVLKRNKVCNLRFILIDQDVALKLDEVVSETDAETRLMGGSAKTGTDIASHDLKQTVGRLIKRGMIEGKTDVSVRFSRMLLPYGLTLIRCDDGTCWMTVQIYPLHPDTKIGQRMRFESYDPTSSVWQAAAKQFEFAWRDDTFSVPFDIRDW